MEGEIERYGGMKGVRNLERGGRKNRRDRRTNRERRGIEGDVQMGISRD